jgi:hypothetical protein
VKGNVTVVARVVALSAIALSLMVATAPAQAATAKPIIGVPAAFGAPTDARGGISNTPVYCSIFNAEPRVKWVLKSKVTGNTRIFHWRGVRPGIHFPRVAVGSYRSTTTAWCRDNRERRVSTVRVWQKTAANTMSKAEFRHIKRGMAPDRVRRIVGYSGRAAGSYGGEKMRAYDIMPFWRWTVIVYRDGEVVRKYWNVDHD